MRATLIYTATAAASSTQTAAGDKRAVAAVADLVLQRVARGRQAKAEAEGEEARARKLRAVVAVAVLRGDCGRRRRVCL
jgi:hypothetical protein